MHRPALTGVPGLTLWYPRQASTAQHKQRNNTPHKLPHTLVQQQAAAHSTALILLAALAPHLLLALLIPWLVLGLLGPWRQWWAGQQQP
jgi:hypothetical protein